MTIKTIVKSGRKRSSKARSASSGKKSGASAKPVRGISFVKMHGAGNDYIYLDARDKAPDNLPELARKMSDRHFGIGADGIILIRRSEKTGVRHRMQMLNADGSESEMCGNGIRCVAKFLYDRNYEKTETFPIETGAGVLTLAVTTKPGPHVAQKVRVNMGKPRLTRAEIPMAGDGGSKCINESFELDGRKFRITCVSMGNPHCVIFLEQPPTDDWVLGLGPKLERHAMFPRRCNIHFVYKQSPELLIQRTWERGTGETLACGTGASAVCVAASLNGLTGRKMTIRVLGGDLEMEWNEKDGCVYKTGPAEEVFSGVWPA